MKVEQFGKGHEHLKVTFETARGTLEAIAFFATPDSFQFEPQVDQSMTLLAHVEQSFFMNRPQLRLRIVDVLQDGSLKRCLDNACASPAILTVSFRLLKFMVG